MPVDGSGHVQLAGQGEQGGHGAVGKRSDGEGFRGAETGQQVVSLAEVSHHPDAGLSVDASGLDNAPVGMTFDAEALKARHLFVYTILETVLSS